MAILACPPAAVTADPLVQCTHPSCVAATSHESLCDCSGCFGAGHGAAHREARARSAAAMRARYLPGQPGFFRSELAHLDDDHDWGVPTQRAHPVAWCDRCMDAADNCDCMVGAR